MTTSSTSHPTCTWRGDTLQLQQNTNRQNWKLSTLSVQFYLCSHPSPHFALKKSKWGSNYQKICYHLIIFLNLRNNTAIFNQTFTNTTLIFDSRLGSMKMTLITYIPRFLRHRKTEDWTIHFFIAIFSNWNSKITPQQSLIAVKEDYIKVQLCSDYCRLTL